MPKFMKYYKDKEKAKAKRYRDRKKNYTKGRVGSRKSNPFTVFERKMIISHTISDRLLANLLESSTNGIQAMRWRIKTGYIKY